MVSNANSQLPITGLAQLQNMNSVDQLKLMLLRNMSPTERQRLFGQQQQQQFRTPMRSSLGQMQSSAGVGSNMSGDILQRLEQFTNRDRTERSGLSVVSESDRSSSSNGSTSVAVGQGGAVDRSYPMQDIEYPGQNDCMFGRGGGTSNHIGYVHAILSRIIVVYTCLMSFSYTLFNSLSLDCSNINFRCVNFHEDGTVLWRIFRIVTT